MAADARLTHRPCLHAQGGIWGGSYARPRPQNVGSDSPRRGPGGRQDRHRVLQRSDGSLVGRTGGTEVLGISEEEDNVWTGRYNTAPGRLGFTTMAAVAEFLGEKIIDDSKRGSREKLEQGKLTHGSACYGYTYIDKRQQDGSKLVINESDSSVPGLSMVEVVREV